MKHLDIQVAEMRSIIHVIRKLVGTGEGAPSSYKKLEKCNQHLETVGCQIVGQFFASSILPSFLFFFFSLVCRDFNNFISPHVIDILFFGFILEWACITF